MTKNVHAVPWRGMGWPFATDKMEITICGKEIALTSKPSYGSDHYYTGQ